MLQSKVSPGKGLAEVLLPYLQESGVATPIQVESEETMIQIEEMVARNELTTAERLDKARNEVRRLFRLRNMYEAKAQAQYRIIAKLEEQQQREMGVTR